MAIITVSRQMGTGGKSLGQKISQALNYAYFDKEKIIADIQKAGGPWASWEREMEACPTLWERFDRSFSGLVALVEKSVLEAAVQNNVVIVGRGANFILRGVSHAFHMRVVGPIDVRTEWIMQHNDIPQDAARKLLKKIDHDRTCYLRTVYHADWNDPRQYDAVFDVGVQSEEQIVRSVSNLVPGKDQAFSVEQQVRLRQKTLAAKVKAALSVEPSLFIPTLQVSHDGARLVVEGIIHKASELQLIRELALKAAQGEPVDLSGVHYRD